MGLFDLFKKQEKSIYSEIDSLEKAKEEFKNGILEKIYIMAPMFGGFEDDNNVLYVPIGVNKIKESYDSMIADLLMQNKVDSYICDPQYKGDSFIPSSIVIVSKKGDKIVFCEKIDIW